MELQLYDVESHIFQTEEDCEIYLMNKRWSIGFCCPRCEHHHAYKITGRRLLECSACKMQVSLTAGTVMHNSKLSLLTWFRAIQLLIENERTYTPTRLATALAVNYRSARLLLQKIDFASFRSEHRRFHFARKKDITSQEVSAVSMPFSTEVNSEPMQVQDIVCKLSNKCLPLSSLETYLKNKKRLHVYSYLNNLNSSGVECTPYLFEKWMRAFVSVTLYPTFLRCFHLPE
ncbi:transposase [Paenibacillus sp. SYP-B3998]|uniref:Transposase n=1 Tax=Paenibacillus sp. SYP-B3998 TaxID=2678564 RepID=A0A6G3ZX11_9BACL|nr:transposase [Paenibacillus sp. SYP-B3998]NEW06244.1 transposase [Paenibacillus sp. SYP-B3998]